MSLRRTVVALSGQVPIKTFRFAGQFTLASTILILAVSGSQARVETPEEADKIMAFLEAEKCQIIRDAMGAKTLGVTDTGFMAEATCSDGKSYIFNLDQKFQLMDKKLLPN